MLRKTHELLMKSVTRSVGKGLCWDQWSTSCLVMNMLINGERIEQDLKGLGGN